MCSSAATYNSNPDCPKGFYDNVLGVEYQWWEDIDTQAKSIGTLVSSLFDSCSSYKGNFDIEAHSEGTVVSLQSIGSMTANTQGKLQHIVLVAGPIDGTPVAQSANNLLILTYYLNLQPLESAAESVLMPASQGDMTTFVGELTPYSAYVLDAQAAAELNAPYAETIAVGGDYSHLNIVNGNPVADAANWTVNWLAQKSLQGQPNDGIVPVSSALPTDSVLPNLVRLLGNDPTAGDYPYPDNHVSLVNNQNVMPDILNSLNSAGETAQVTLNISPLKPTVLVDQSLTFTANTANILNPQIQWTFNGGTTTGSLSSSTGISVQYLAPGTPGGPFPISATLPAIVQGSSSNPLTNSTSISVNNPVPTITLPLVPTSLPVGSTSQELTINGTGFLPSSTVTFNGSSHTATFVSATQLTIGLTSADLATVGTFPVAVVNPAPGGGTATANFAVLPLVSISPSAVSVPTSSVQSFLAKVYGGGTVTWSVVEGASGGSITAEGLYTAPSQSGTYHVKATSSANTSAFATSTVSVVTGPSIATIHSFNHATEGANPWAAPVFGSDGYLYGTTEAGGNLSCAYISTLSGCGTIYKSDTSGNVSTLHNFAGLDGAYPGASLKAASGGLFYGTTDFGGSNTSQCDVGGTATPAGCGTVFSFSASAGFASLSSFGPYNSSLGVGPESTLTQTSAGILYGTNEVGGNATCTGTLGTTSRSGCGAVFSISTANVPSALHTFSGSEGAYPAAGLLPQSDGNFYGTTAGGGTLTCSSYATLGCGTVFQMNSANAIKTLHAFTEQDGASPNAALILGADGNMYGTTLFGGSTTCSGGAQWQGCGTVFKIDTAGNFTPLHSFSGPDGAYPATLMQASDGYFYGTTESGGDTACTGRYGPGCGTLFRMDSSGNVTVLYEFTGKSDGSWPESALVQGTDGNLYGTAVYGGANDDGVVFRVSNLTALASGAVVVNDLPEVQTTVTPVLVTRPHVGPPGPPVSTQP
jgi:uncharacterized repeat protein (TIGR03803 family)